MDSKITTEERWVELYGFPNYEISNLGNVRNARTGKVKIIRTDGRQYRIVHLWYNKRRYTKRVSRLVWASFNNQFCSKTIDHINQDGGDDRIENLRCVSQKENNDARKPYKRCNRYNLTKEIKGYIHDSITKGTETTWTIKNKYGIPLNYLQTTMRRGSWKKFVKND